MLPADPVAWALDRFRDDGRQASYSHFGRYYEGIQRLQFATPKFEQTFGTLFDALTYNRARSVVDSLADRLHITGFQPRGGGDAKPVTQLWQDNDMDQREGEVYVESFSEGDAYALIWPEATQGDLPVIWAQQAGQARVLYDDERPGRIILAAKLWATTDDYIRLNIYLPDRLEKYISRSKWKTGLPRTTQTFEQYRESGVDMAWPLYYNAIVPGRDWTGTVPMFHFGNNARTNQYGHSELADVVPLQDGLNKAIADVMVTAERMGFPQWWITGWAPAINPQTGKAESPPFDVGINNLIAVGSEGAKMGQFAAANLVQLISLVEMFDLAVARVSRVPVHYLGLTSNFPSGESLKTAEAPFVRKAQDRQIAFGNVWSRVMTLAMRMQGLDLAFRLDPIYESAEPRTEAEMAQNAVSMKTAGLPLPAILRMAFKLNEDEVAAVLKESDAMVERARALFDSGETNANPDFGNPDTGQEAA